MTYGHCTKSSRWHKEIWSFSHPDDFVVVSISSGRLMDIAGCQPNDFRCYPISSRWHNVIRTKCHLDNLAPGCISSGWLMVHAVYHPKDIRCYAESSGWHDEIWVNHPDVLLDVISMRVSKDEFIISPGWYTPPLLIHTDETEQILIFHNVQWSFSASILLQACSIYELTTATTMLMHLRPVSASPVFLWWYIDNSSHRENLIIGNSFWVHW